MYCIVVAHMKRTILLSDLNSFYASVECLYNPALRTRPIAVCGSVEDRHGIVLAANPLAKRYGIRTGDAVWQAKQKCKNITIVEPHMERYVAVSKTIQKIYQDFSPLVEQYGLDESYLDLTGTEHIHGSGKQAADTIRERIYKECGITASVGVSFTRSFAKLASDMKKPDATTVITRDDIRTKVWPLPASDLLMVGRATVNELKSACIHTIGDLAQTDPGFLEYRFGVNGLLIRAYANGEDNEPVMETGWRTKRQGFSNSTTTPRDLVSVEDIRLVAMLLAESVTERMREKGFVCRTVQVWIRYNDMASFQHQTGLPFPTRTARMISGTAIALILRNRRRDVPIRSLGVRVCDLLLNENPQLSFMPDQAADQKQEQLEMAMQEVRKRFGHFSIERGAMLADKKLSGLDTRDAASAQSVAFFRGEP